MSNKPAYLCTNEDCERAREGLTPFCSTCNAGLRRLERDLSKPVKEKKAVKKFTPKRTGQNSIYSQTVKTWIVGKRCACCGDPATDCHHMKGRTNELLLEKKYWLAVCRGCHRLMTEDSAWAIKEGYSISRNATV